MAEYAVPVALAAHAAVHVLLTGLFVHVVPHPTLFGGRELLGAVEHVFAAGMSRKATVQLRKILSSSSGRWRVTDKKNLLLWQGW